MNLLRLAWSSLVTYILQDVYLGMYIDQLSHNKIVIAYSYTQVKLNFMFFNTLYVFLIYTFYEQYVKNV